MNRQSCSEKLQQLLNAENQYADKLMSVLKMEREALPRNSDKLQIIDNEKTDLLQQLDKSHSQRNAFVQQSGYDPTFEGTESFIAWCDNTGNLLKIWKQFIDKIEQNKQIYALNGSIINSGLRVVKHALSVIHNSQGGAVNIYDASGQQHSSSSTRSIAKA